MAAIRVSRVWDEREGGVGYSVGGTQGCCETVAE